MIMLNNFLKTCITMGERLLCRRSFLRGVQATKSGPRNYISFVVPRMINPWKLFFIAQVALLSKESLQNIDLKLKEASGRSDKAVSDLMDRLINNVLDIAKGYKECLRKQIKILDEANRNDPRSVEQMTEHRVRQSELEEQWYNLKTSINTIGGLVEKKKIKLITANPKHEEIVTKKYGDLKAIISRETVEIKSLYKRLLVARKKNILKY